MHSTRTNFFDGRNHGVRHGMPAQYGVPAQPRFQHGAHNNAASKTHAHVRKTEENRQKQRRQQYNLNRQTEGRGSEGETKRKRSLAHASFTSRK